MRNASSRAHGFVLTLKLMWYLYKELISSRPWPTATIRSHIIALRMEKEDNYIYAFKKFFPESSLTELNISNAHIKGEPQKKYVLNDINKKILQN